MSQRNGRHRGALLTLLLALLTISFVAWIEVTHRDAYYYGGQATYNQDQERPDSWVFEVVPNAGSPWHDTYAQWAMAFLAAVATGASMIAVYLLYKTLAATQGLLDQARESTDAATLAAGATKIAAEAAQAANALAREQFVAGFKPWLEVSLVAGEYEVFHTTPGIATQGATRLIVVSAVFNVRNIGDMPATIEGFKVSMATGSQWPYFDGHVRTPHGGLYHVLGKGEAIVINPTLGIIPAGSAALDISAAIESARIPVADFGTYWTHKPPILGVLTYSDPLGSRWDLHFAIGEPSIGRGSRYGGREYNYESKAADQPPHGAAPTSPPPGV